MNKPLFHATRSDYKTPSSEMIPIQAETCFAESGELGDMPGETVYEEDF